MRRHLMKAGGNALPDWFRQHIVCWYDPRRQGCTNESMAADPTLKDLSGKGRDATCTNFGWTASSGVGNDGALVFSNGSEACNISPENIVFTDFTVIIDRKETDNPGTYKYTFIKQTSISSSGRATIGIPAFMSSYDFYSFSYGQIHTNYAVPTDGVEYMTSTKYMEHPLTKGPWSDTPNGIMRLGSRTMQLRRFFLFDAVLTDEQIEYVINNLTD